MSQVPTKEQVAIALLRAQLSDAVIDYMVNMNPISDELKDLMYSYAMVELVKEEFDCTIFAVMARIKTYILDEVVSDLNIDFLSEADEMISQLTEDREEESDV